MSKCQVCGGALGRVVFPYTTRFNDKIFSYRECLACASICVDPLPDEADLSLMYSQTNYHDAYYSTVDFNRYNKSIGKVISHLGDGSGKSLLDFGCGSGAFMLAARKFGFDCVGVEFADSTISQAAKISNCEVMSLDKLIPMERKFDVIHMGHVLEHLPDPRSVVMRMLEMLKPCGVLYIEGPCERNPSLACFIAIKIGQVKRLCWPDFIAAQPPYHLQLTTGISQKMFFVDQINLSCEYFSIEDSGGAYAHANLLTIDGFVKRLISVLSIWLSQLFPQFGDLFVAILRPVRPPPHDAA